MFFPVAAPLPRPIGLRALACCAALSLAPACSTTPITSAIALARVDPLTTDASAIRLAVSLPDTLQLSDPRLSMDGTLAYTDGRPTSRHRFALVPVDDTGPAGARVFALEDRAGIAALDAFRAEIRAAEAAGVKGTGTLSVDPALCRTTADLPPVLPAIVHIRTAETGRFVPLNRPLDALDAARGAGMSPAAIDVALPRCRGR